MPKRWTGTSPVSSQQHETGCSSMTQHLCIKQLSGLRGTTIHTSPSSVLRLLAQLIQVVVIHLATGGSHGATATLVQSLSSRASALSSHSDTANNQPRVDHSSISKTRMSENSLDNAIFAEDQGIRRRSVRLGRSRMAEVTSLMESSYNQITGWDKAHIIRETNERATREE